MRNHSTQGYQFHFRFYGLANTENTDVAILNFEKILLEYCLFDVLVDYLDVALDANLPLLVEDEIFSVPAIVRLKPEPMRKIIGCLNDTDQVARYFGFELRHRHLESPRFLTESMASLIQKYVKSFMSGLTDEVSVHYLEMIVSSFKTQIMIHFKITMNSDIELEIGRLCVHMVQELCERPAQFREIFVRLFQDVLPLITEVQEKALA